MLPRRAKIVCTIGPACHEPAQLEALLRAGMDVARLNFSHGTHDDHRSVIRELRRLSAERAVPLAILQDLQGPKIRIGSLADGSVILETGAALTITTRDVRGDAAVVSTAYDSLPRDVKPGDQILLSDGLLQLEVKETTATDVLCRVVDGGSLRARAGMNLPGSHLSTPALTDKDRADLEFGLDEGVDFVALSFVRQAADVLELQRLISDRGATTPVVAKLEKPEAIAQLDEILDVADGVMIARGDLGVELSPERVPFLQKEIIARAAAYRVPVITATQMLESMIEHPRPTRAEASDVANAIVDGTDAVMLSGETAVGHYPVEAVGMMVRIVLEAEAHATKDPPSLRRRREDGPSGFPDAIAASACRAAEEVGARAIVAFTNSGFTARLISKYHPAIPVYAYCEDETVQRRLCLYWGVLPRRSDFIEDIELKIEDVDEALVSEGSLEPGDPIVILAGTPSGVRGTTNMLKLHRTSSASRH